MKEQAVHVPFNRTTYLEDGSKVVAYRQKKQERRRTPGTTARHEIRHAFVAEKRNPGSLRRASIVPGPGYLGITEISKMDPAAAAAAHAEGMSGTSWDMHIVRSMGETPQSACATARAVMSGYEEEMDDLAAILEERKTMTGSEIRHEMGAFKHTNEVVLYILSPRGEETKIVKPSSEAILLPTEVPVFSRAA